MPLSRAWLAALAVMIAMLLAGPIAAQPRPASEQIGSWVLSCPDAQPAPCQLRHQSWVIPPGTARPSASLEVLHRGDRFVPVVALRGLSAQAALGGVLALKATVGVRFDGAPRIELPCALDGLAIVCAPDTPGATAAAATLAGARSVLVLVQLTLPGIAALPEQSRALDLQATQDALARFRATSPSSEAVPALPGLDWRGLLDRVLRDMGLTRGTADLVPAIAVPLTR